MTAIQFLGAWLVRSSILVLAGTLLLWLLRVNNPRARLTAWMVLLAGSLLLPLLTAALPQVPLSIPLPPARTYPAVASSLARLPVVIHPWTTVRDTISAPAPQAVNAKPSNRMRLAALLYALVALILLLRLFCGLALSLRILRRSRATGIVAGGIEVCESDRVASPVAIGLLRPAILLPPDWRDWGSAKLDAVLAHEQSHIRRRDPAVQFLSAIHRALLWAGPLSWFLDRQIVRTAEHVSDDDAVAATRDRLSYAELLLEFVQRSSGQADSLGVAMARHDRPEKRIRRILNSAAIPHAVTRWGILAILGLAAPLAYLAAAASPQYAPRPDPPAAFDVASIKPVDPTVPHLVGVKVYPGGRVVISTFSLRTLIATAFGLSIWQISGGDQWTVKDTYDIEAKPPEALQSSIRSLRYTNFGIDDERLRAMLQTLLIDRFQLKLHRETKTGDVCLLERGGKTLRLRPAESRTAGADPPADRSSFGSIGYVGGKWAIFATTMPQLANFASGFILHVPVLDRTGLRGSFDYTQRQPDLEPKYDGDQSDSFRSYLAELGLKLERAKGPVETFVIDHAAKPSPN